MIERAQKESKQKIRVSRLKGDIELGTFYLSAARMDTSRAHGPTKCLSWHSIAKHTLVQASTSLPQLTVCELVPGNSLPTLWSFRFSSILQSLFLLGPWRTGSYKTFLKARPIFIGLWPRIYILEYIFKRLHFIWHKDLLLGKANDFSYHCICLLFSLHSCIVYYFFLVPHCTLY